MGSMASQFERVRGEREYLRQLEGVERVALLPYASHVAIAPGTSAEEPPYVFIEWAPGGVERPYPGTTIWRAVLERYLTEPHDQDPASAALRQIVAESLRRFSSLDAWLRWVDHERLAPAPGERAHRFAWPTIVWPW